MSRKVGRRMAISSRPLLVVSLVSRPRRTCTNLTSVSPGWKRPTSDACLLGTKYNGVVAEVTNTQ